MMTDEQRFLFDLNGYLVLEGVLDPERVKRMNKDMLEHDIKDPENSPDQSRFGNFLKWGDDWRELIDHPAILPLLTEILGSKFRLDHAYGMAARADGKRSEHAYLHHEGGMFDHGCYYVTHGQRMHNGLIVVSYALTDIKPGVGGFCCIPGTHKVQQPMPHESKRIENNPLVRQIPQKAGDVVIFTEALTHGTMPWTDTAGERRSVLLKYCPGYMRWAQKDMDSDIEGLTDRQRLILEGPGVGAKQPVPV